MATVRVKVVALAGTKLAVQVFAVVIVTVAVVAVPLQSPPQESNFEPVSGVAVKVTRVLAV